MALQACTADNIPKFTFESNTRQISKCLRVIDGDTACFTITINDKIYQHSCRMAGYNSAEIHGKTIEEKTAAAAAKKALENLILEKIVELEYGPSDKYGRPLVTVWVKSTRFGIPMTDSKSVNDMMIETGHGAPYNGRGEKKY